MHFLKESFNAPLPMTRCIIIILKNDFIITEPIFYGWNVKIIQNINVYGRIDC